MTKKQLKQLAKKFVDLEHIIQENADSDAVNRAKDEMMKLTEANKLSFEDMILLDEMIQKNI